MLTVTIVGPGRAGGALAIALDRAGCRVDRIVYRQHLPENLTGYFGPDRFLVWEDFKAVETQVLIIATGDPEIGATAGRIAHFQKLPKTALHLSGSMDSRELEALADAGISVGSIHPLVSLSDPVLGADRIAGSFFCLEGDESAVTIGRELAGSLGASAFTIPTESKPLYHASAVMASGHLTALIETSIEMLAKCGMTAIEAKRVLFPLISSTISNLEGQSPSKALTGTFARGDRAAFERHLESIAAAGSDDVREIYIALGKRSIEILRRDGVGRGRLEELEQAILMAKENCR